MIKSIPRTFVDRAVAVKDTVKRSINAETPRGHRLISQRNRDRKMRRKRSHSENLDIGSMFRTFFR